MTAAGFLLRSKEKPYSALEQRIGRRLTAAEQHIAVEEIDGLLNRAVDDLHELILAEQARYARAKARRHAARLEPTAAMVALLRRLRDEGRTHAERELASMGYPLRRRQHAADDPPPDPFLVNLFATSTLDDFEATLRARLHTLTAKIERDALAADLSTIATSAIERAVLKVLGGRSIAADLVAPVFGSGLAVTFEQHADLVEQWQYSAVLDSGLCENCRAYDGRIFDSLAALFAVLPDFSGNPSCLGGTRCRCRALPVPPAPRT